MGARVAMIDRTYGHLARDSEDAIRARLDARAERSGVEWRRTASDGVEPRRETPRLAGGFGDGSDGTRTRDLRRDRPR